MPPYDFQELVAELLKAMGYHVAWVSPPGKDAGIDIVAWVDPLGTRPPRIKVQVKRRTDKVGADGLRSFLAVIGAEDVGIYVAAGGFTTLRSLDRVLPETQRRRPPPAAPQTDLLPGSRRLSSSPGIGHPGRSGR
jgi:restriction endonuclease Mrr